MRGRRRWLAAGTALAVTVLGGAAVLWGVTGDDPEVGRGDDPARPAVTVLTARDAEPATARLSRAIRRELAGDARTVGVPWPRDVEPRLIIGAQYYPTSVEVVDPRTGERTPLPTVWKGHSISVTPIRVTKRAVWVSWVHHVDGVARPAAMRYDVGTGRHKLVLAPEVPHHARANFTSALEMGDDGRLYFRTYRPGTDWPDKFTQLWSFAPDAPDGPRREGEAQQWTVAGSLLASLAYDGHTDPVILRVRDLTTGEEHVNTFEHCDDPYLEASAALVVVSCSDAPDMVVLDGTATPLARLRVSERVRAAGYGPPSLHVGERWLSAGRLAYQPATGRLVHLQAPAGS